MSNEQNEGFEFSGLTESGTYVINGNFDPTYNTTVQKDGEPYALTVASISSTSNVSSSSLVFMPETEILECSIDDVSLENQTQYLGFLSSAQDFVISDTFNPSVNDYITWDNEKINFNSAPDDAFIYQNIGILQESDTYKITLEGVAFNEDIDDKIRVYYRNEDNLGFEFTFTANGFIEKTETISFSQAEFDFPDNALVIAPASNTTLSATVDNISVRKVLTNEPEHTLSYSEQSKGWVSFKSFIPESGVSLSGSYYTFKDGKLFKHDSNENRGQFYESVIVPKSSITFIMNREPSIVKNFNTLNYEGSEGWVNDYLTTDMQSGYASDFIEKEGKWFNYLHGGIKSLAEGGEFYGEEVVDTSNFTFQGIGTTIIE